MGAVEAARELGAVTIGVSCTPDSELARAVRNTDHTLSGPEILAGSTRMEGRHRHQARAEHADHRGDDRLGFVSET